MPSLRNKLKVYKHSLFYFKSDKTVGILKMSLITKVINGTNTEPGSTVLLKYPKQIEPLEAEIIAVEGK